jgi:hypothetical protein
MSSWMFSEHLLALKFLMDIDAFLPREQSMAPSLLQAQFSGGMGDLPASLCIGWSANLDQKVCDPTARPSH